MPDDDLEGLEIELLLTAVARRFGYDFREYAPASLRRRIRRAMQREGVRSPSALQERLLHDPGALHRFVSCISVNVTSMFRDPPFYARLRQQVVPLLRTFPFTRIWVAGCASGEEAYSLAILLEEEGLYDRCRIYATDLSDQQLYRARQGVYPLRDMETYAKHHRDAGGRTELARHYVADDQHAVMRDSLRRNLLFSHHNLASDGSFNEFQLILCRNVLIYFDDPLKDRVHRLLHGSLVRSGVLGLGLRESITYTPHADDYEAVDEQLRLYRRVR